MDITLQNVVDWTPIVCLLISMGCFILFGPRLRILGPLGLLHRRMAITGTIFFFLGLGLFVLRLILRWFS